MFDPIFHIKEVVAYLRLPQTQPWPIKGDHSMGHSKVGWVPNPV